MDEILFVLDRVAFAGAAPVIENGRSDDADEP
jgi:hypothetical protein